MAGKKTDPNRVPPNAVLLSDVASLTFRDGQRTTSRRVSPVEQLSCVGPREVCRLYTVDVMRCVNEGADYDADNIQWSCRASLPEEFKLGSTDVVCEGYESRDDPWVLKGSCAVEYRLLLTDVGERKFANHNNNNERNHGYRGMDRDMPVVQVSVDDGGGNAATKLFLVLFFVVLFVILRGMWQRYNENSRRTPRGGGGGYGGGGGGGGYDDNDDPPPPYEGPPSYPHSPRNTKSGGVGPRGAAGAGSPRNYTSSRASSQRQQQSWREWRPGFWTGAATGAAAGYYASTRGQTTQSSSSTTRSEMREQRRQPSSSYDWSSSPSTSLGSTRHESTGFGGTSRR